MNTTKQDMLTNVYIELSNIPTEVSTTQIDVIEMYLIEVYYPQENIASLTDLRLKHFSKSPNPKLRNRIISIDALINHINVLLFKLVGFGNNADIMLSILIQLNGDGIFVTIHIQPSGAISTKT